VPPSLGRRSGSYPIDPAAVVAHDAGVIEIEHLTKRYGGKVAVDDLSFAVRPGHVTGFLGPNGAGKTTTMAVILGFAAPTHGRATVNGVPYSSLRAPLRVVGSLLDARAVHGGRRACDHLQWLARTHDLDARRVDEVLGITGLESVAHRRIKTYSLGMAQRLGIAAARLGDPEILLFDEPVNGLDPEGIRWIRELLRSLASEGRTVLVSSHLMSEMAITADHLVVIGRGRLIADASVADVVDQQDLGAVRVRSPEQPRLHAVLTANDAVVDCDDGALIVRGVSAETIGDTAAAHGIALHELVPLRPTLEEAFMELTGTAVEFAGGVSA
jgi:ABC-2 type transport system ATP-binding protein